MKKQPLDVSLGVVFCFFVFLKKEFCSIAKQIFGKAISGFSQFMCDN